jgi:hypothetical protein
MLEFGSDLCKTLNAVQGATSPQVIFALVCSPEGPSLTEAARALAGSNAAIASQTAAVSFLAALIRRL